MPREFYLRDPGQKRDVRAATKAKLAGRCEACDWGSPAALGAPPLVHAHHILPVCCLGSDHESNLIALCPTCHAIAHRVSIRRVDAFHRWLYQGPRSREDLIARLVQLRTDPDAFEVRYQLDVLEMRRRLDRSVASAETRRRRKQREGV